MRKSLTAVTALALSVTATPAFAADYLWFDSDHTSYSAEVIFNGQVTMAMARR